MLSLGNSMNNLACIQELKAEGYQLFILINTNPLHHAKIMSFYSHASEKCLEQKSFGNIFDQEYYSFITKQLKLNAQAFITVLKDNRLEAEQTLFIDDEERNICVV